MIETDYDNACIYLKRGDKIEQTFKFKEFVSAADFKPVNDLRNKLSAIARGEIKVEPEVADNMDIDFYVKATNISLTNPLSYEESIKVMTAPEIGALAEEILIFLVNWSTTEAVKKYASLLAETQKKEPEQPKDSQKSQNG